MVKYYDIFTKKEIDKKEIKPGIPYFEVHDNWVIRTIVFNEDGTKKKTFIKLEDEINLRIVMIRARLNEQNCTIHNISYQTEFVVDGVKFYIPNYYVDYSRQDGTREKDLLDDSLNKIINETAEGKIINITNQRISNGTIISIPGIQRGNQSKQREKDYTDSRQNSSSIEVQENIPRSQKDAKRRKEEATQRGDQSNQSEKDYTDSRQNSSSIKVHVNQWGFEKTYTYNSLRELYEDQGNIPRSQEDANRRREEATRYDQ